MLGKFERMSDGAEFLLAQIDTGLVFRQGNKFAHSSQGQSSHADQQPPPRHSVQDEEEGNDVIHINIALNNIVGNDYVNMH